MALRVGILGARGIGKVHARIFHALGDRVCAVLGSSSETAVAAVEDLRVSYGIRATPYHCLDELLKQPLDALSICTPESLHYGQVVAALDRGLPVFCEKPLFWEENLSWGEIERRLAVLESHPQRRLTVNTSNNLLLEAVKDRLADPEDIRSFEFRFHTRGRYRGQGIAVDLLPHGASLLLSLFGERTLADLDCVCHDDRWSCEFIYGGTCRVKFDFQQDPAGAKLLEFAANGRTFRRRQEGQSATYRLCLEDSGTNEDIPVPDPFAVAISRFRENCVCLADSASDGFDTAAEIMRLMARCLGLN